MQSKMNKLPYEMVYTIYDYIDYDTKVVISLDRYKDVLNKRYVFELFSIQQLQHIYRHCVIDKISTYNKETRKRSIKKEFVSLFPPATYYNYIDENGMGQHVYQEHPIISILEDFKKSATFDKKLKGTMLIRAIHGFSNMSSGDINIDYVLRKVAYQTIQTIVYYKKIVLLKKQIMAEERIVRSQLRQEQQLVIAAEKQCEKESKLAAREEKNRMIALEREENRRIKMQYRKQELIASKLNKEKEANRKRFQNMRGRIEKALVKRDNQKIIIIPYTMQIKKMN